MGICINGRYNGKSSPYSLAMSYGTFFLLRKQVASHLCKEFFEHYSLMADAIFSYSDKEKEDYNQKTMEIIERNELDKKKYQEKILDFLYAPDCEGSISYGTCRRIYELIKDDPDELRFGYAGWGKDCSTMGDFKNLLADVAKNKGKVTWS